MNSTRTIAVVALTCALAVVAGIALGLILASPSQPLVGSFTDIQGHWAAPYIEQIRLAGLTAGCNTNPPMYCPDAPLTRAEAAVFLARLLVTWW